MIENLKIESDKSLTDALKQMERCGKETSYGFFQRSVYRFIKYWQIYKELSLQYRFDNSCQEKFYVRIL